MKKAKILIAEDDVLISEELYDILINYGFDVVGIAEDYDTAVNMITSNPPDLVLLDIKMNGSEQGFEIADYLNRIGTIPFIFITSYYDDNTLKAAGQLEPASYITKPFSKEQVFSAINIVLSSELYSNKIINIQDGLKSYSISKNELLWIKADGVYVEIVTKDKKILIRTNIKSLLENYPEMDLHRVHRSYAVNLRAASSVTISKIKFKNEIIPIGRSYKESLQKLFNLTKS